MWRGWEHTPGKEKSDGRGGDTKWGYRGDGDRVMEGMRYRKRDRNIGAQKGWDLRERT